MNPANKTTVTNCNARIIYSIVCSALIVLTRKSIKYTE